MQAWIGNVIGSSIGLLAILLGALWNAHLTRKRDRLLHEEEKSVLQAALAVELSVVLEMAAGRFMQAVFSRGNLSHEMFEALKPPALMLWPKLCDRLGLLEGPISVDVIKAFALMEWHLAVVRATVDEAAAGTLAIDKAKLRSQMFARDVPLLKNVISSLGGNPPDGLLFPEFGV